MSEHQSKKADKVKRKPRAMLQRADVLRIVGESLCHEQTVRSWASGAKVQPISATRIQRACSKLGIEVLA